MTRQAAEQAGRRGETLAAWWLRLHGWRILAQRVKIGQGEVDLIAKRGRTIAFVEVKWRKKAADLATAIDGWRLRRVSAAAHILAPRYAKNGENISIDVLLLAPGRFPHHVRNALIDMG
jgi:putative endonuclease